MIGCFSGVVALALAKGGVFDPENKKMVENETKISTINYMLGMGAIFITSWMFSGITVITR